eukprot:TRINITY_DN14367_c0_g1_i1.p2 TRINITY_DN14367_c0_g1~~TRINITY_DN14367_c0_g1_i1.p2  ORF type:complete len:166 (-),score=29.07 TRINITY_DN14367_c0_g1_i1:67-564(-)
MLARLRSTLTVCHQQTLPASGRRELRTKAPGWTPAAQSRPPKLTYPPPQTRDVVPPPKFGLDVGTFLELVHPECAQHAPKFASWTDLFQATSLALKQRGLSVHHRKWVRRAVEQYKQGFYPTGWTMTRSPNWRKYRRELLNKRKQAHEDYLTLKTEIEEANRDQS